MSLFVEFFAYSTAGVAPEWGSLGGKGFLMSQDRGYHYHAHFAEKQTDAQRRKAIM